MSTQELIAKHRRYMQKDTHPENEGAAQERAVLAALEHLKRFEEREPLVQALVNAVMDDPCETPFDEAACAVVRFDNPVLQDGNSALDPEVKTGDKPGAVSGHTSQAVENAVDCHLSSVVEQRFRKPSNSPEIPDGSNEKPVNAGEELYECESCSRKPGSPLLCSRCLRARSAAGTNWRGMHPTVRAEIDAYCMKAATHPAPSAPALVRQWAKEPADPETQALVERLATPSAPDERFAKLRGKPWTREEVEAFNAQPAPKPVDGDVEAALEWADARSRQRQDPAAARPCGEAEWPEEVLAAEVRRLRGRP